MVVKAAQVEGMTVVPEGGSLFTQDVTLIQDGNSTVEHNIPLDIFYKDLVQLWGQTEVDYTPTLVVTYGGPAGDPYWRAHTNEIGRAHVRNPVTNAHLVCRLLL